MGVGRKVGWSAAVAIAAASLLVAPCQVRAGQPTVKGIADLKDKPAVSPSGLANALAKPLDGCKSCSDIGAGSGGSGASGAGSNTGGGSGNPFPGPSPTPPTPVCKEGQRLIILGGVPRCV